MKRFCTERMSRRGFTLVEILAAIVIISILAGMVTFGGRAALNFFRGVGDKACLDNVAKALELYKQKYDEYPPDGTDMAAVRRHLLKRNPEFTKPANIADLNRLLAKLQDAAYKGQLLTYWLCGEEWILDGSQMGESEFIDLNPGFSKPAEVGTSRTGINYNIYSHTLCNAKGFPVVYFRANKTVKDDLFRYLWDWESEDRELVPITYSNGETFYNEVMDIGNGGPYSAEDPREEDCGCYFGDLSAGTDEVSGLHPYRHCEEHSDGLWFNPDTYQLILPGEDGLYTRVPGDDTTRNADLDNVTNFCAGPTMAEEEFEGRHAEHDNHEHE